MESSARSTLGIFSEPSVQPPNLIFGNVDLVALANLPRDATRHESRGRHSFPAGNQSTNRTRLALLCTRHRVPGLALLCGGSFRGKKSVVDCDARHCEISAAHQLHDATGTTCK